MTRPTNTQLQARVTELEQELAAFKERVVETMHRYAEENGYCDDYRRAIREIGLRPKATEKDVSFVLEVTVRGTPTEATEQAVQSIVDRESWQNENGALDEVLARTSYATQAVEAALVEMLNQSGTLDGVTLRSVEIDSFDSEDNS